ncbi:hypothetical protein [Methylovorus mays]|uniref:hypothetical protein n=1 Tax=Methylovorus mays TaxID=184077 RepID=UPI001E457902|nr:hypothetical protein [Methylovorus mays]MCB5205856.1 hypothetical protein [Methylovorus mays]
MKTKRTIFCVGGDSHASQGSHVMATPNQYIRFWIITMMLVLVGLSTLKLR